jgi:hypothetical protein
MSKGIIFFEWPSDLEFIYKWLMDTGRDPDNVSFQVIDGLRLPEILLMSDTPEQVR